MALTERRKKEITSLSQKKYRTTHAQFIVEGVRSVESALQAGAPLVEIVVSEEKIVQPRIASVVKGAGLPVHVVSAREFGRLGEVETAQGILAVARIVLLPEVELARMERILVLDGVQDPGNTGTIIRTAAWFGIEAVVAGPGTADFFNPKVVRAAMGGLWDVGLAESGNLPGLIARFKAAGHTVCGADLEGRPVSSWKPDGRTVLVLGSEAHGLSAGVRDALDTRVLIEGSPRRRGAESLNVASAAAVLVHHWQTSLDSR